MNYQHTKIYKIIDSTSNAIYVGSTCKTLEQRLNQHIVNNKSKIMLKPLAHKRFLRVPSGFSK